MAVVLTIDKMLTVVSLYMRQFKDLVPNLQLCNIKLYRMCRIVVHCQHRPCGMWWHKQDGV